MPRWPTQGLVSMKNGPSIRHKVRKMTMIRLIMSFEGKSLTRRGIKISRICELGSSQSHFLLIVQAGE
jgi:hypothetical protein